MSETNVDLNFLAKQLQTLTTEMRQVRKDCADARSLAVQTYELSRRSERRDMELRDDLELMLKMEIGGAVAHLQSKMDEMIAPLDDRLAMVENRLAVVDTGSR